MLSIKSEKTASSPFATSFNAIYTQPGKALAGALSVALLVGGYFYQTEVTLVTTKLLNYAPAKEEIALNFAKSLMLKVLQAGSLLVLTRLGDEFIHSSAGKWCAETQAGQWIDKKIISWIPKPSYAQRAYDFVINLGGLLPSLRPKMPSQPS